MPTIERLTALEILDSRGRPTVRATCVIDGGLEGTASVPSGASTGAAEAVELRDGDASRYEGLGCRKAVANIADELSNALVGREFASQEALDRRLISIDGTSNKARLGANAILAVSLAYARAVASLEGVPLYRSLAFLAGTKALTLPRLTVNLFSGGKHAGQQVAIQDVLLYPVSTATIDDSLAMVYHIYQTAAREIANRYGMRLLRADEGGLAPPCRNVEEMLALAVDCIRSAGYVPGVDVALAIDAASTHFYGDGAYDLDERRITSAAMIGRLQQWAGEFPIVSIEDGLAEDDWDNWPRLMDALGSQCVIIGDDLLCTNPERIRRAIETDSANGLLLKVNQIGTLTEAAESLALARDAGWNVTVSARSGETEDNWLADIAVAWGADQIKIGSITQSERLSKYNRLLEIESDSGFTFKEHIGPDAA